MKAPLLGTRDASKTVAPAAYAAPEAVAAKATAKGAAAKATANGARPAAAESGLTGAPQQQPTPKEAREHARRAIMESDAASSRQAKMAAIAQADALEDAMVVRAKAHEEFEQEKQKQVQRLASAARSARKDASARVSTYRTGVKQREEEYEKWLDARVAQKGGAQHMPIKARTPRFTPVSPGRRATVGKPAVAATVAVGPGTARPDTYRRFSRPMYVPSYARGTASSPSRTRAASPPRPSTSPNQSDLGAGAASRGLALAPGSTKQQVTFRELSQGYETPGRDGSPPRGDGLGNQYPYAATLLQKIGWGENISLW